MPKRGKLSLLAILLLLLLTPSQLAIFFWPQWSFVYGLRIDYLAPALYLSDIVILGVLALNARKTVLSLFRSRIFWLVLVFAVLNILFSQFPIFTFYRWLKVGEFISLGLIVAKNREEIKKHIWFPLSTSVLLVTFLSILQMLAQGSIGGIFYWIGERSFTANTPGIALMQINGQEFLRPYASFAHPNILGGFAILSAIFLWNDKKRLFVRLAILASLLLLIVSYSQSAWIALGSVLAVSLLQKRSNIKIITKAILISVVVLSLLLPLWGWSNYQAGEVDSSASIQSRASLAIVAGSLASSKPLLGVGLGNFIPATPQVVSEYPDLFSTVRFAYLQPVHNLFLLVFSETGLVGLGLFVLMLYYFIKQKNVNVLPIIVILVIGLLDHYFLTLQQGLLLTVFALSLSIKKA